MWHANSHAELIGVRTRISLALLLLLGGCPQAMSDDFQIEQPTSGGTAGAASEAGTTLAEAGSAGSAGSNADASSTGGTSGSTGQAGSSSAAAGTSASAGTAGTSGIAPPPPPPPRPKPPPVPPAPDIPACGTRPAPPGGECPEQCNAGCVLGVCLISCDDNSGCSDRNLSCPPGFACRVDCRTPDSCRNTEVRCPERYACELGCSGAACDGAKLSCSSGTCALECAFDCKSAQLNCGSGACSAPCAGHKREAPHVNCGAACDCRGGDACGGNGD